MARRAMQPRYGKGVKVALRPCPDCGREVECQTTHKDKLFIICKRADGGCGYRGFSGRDYSAKTLQEWEEHKSKRNSGANDNEVHQSDPGPGSDPAPGADPAGRKRALPWTESLFRRGG